MNIPKTLNQSAPVYAVTDPSDNDTTIVYSVGPAWMVIYAYLFVYAAAFLWAATAVVYWFVFMYGVIAGLV